MCMKPCFALMLFSWRCRRTQSKTNFPTWTIKYIEFKSRVAYSHVTMLQMLACWHFCVSRSNKVVKQCRKMVKEWMCKLVRWMRITRTGEISRSKRGVQERNHLWLVYISEVWMCSYHGNEHFMFACYSKWLSEEPWKPSSAALIQAGMEPQSCRFCRKLCKQMGVNEISSKFIGFSVSEQNAMAVNLMLRWVFLDQSGVFVSFRLMP